jgi:hypothetical protein
MRRFFALFIVTAHTLAGHDLDVMFSLHMSVPQHAITLKITNLGFV